MDVLSSMSPSTRAELPYPDLTDERQGNTGTLGVWHMDSGLPGKHVLLTALVHGSEVCGAWALKDLLALQPMPRQGKLTLAFCNLAAFDLGVQQQGYPPRYVQEDFNRVWSSAKLNDPCTLERQRALDILPWLEQADWLLDFHSMEVTQTPLQLSGVLSKNIELAKALGNPPHIVADAGHASGARLRDYGRFGDPLDLETRSLLIECGRHRALSSRRVAVDVMVRFLVESGLFLKEDFPSDWSMPSVSSDVLQVTHAITATSSNVRFTQDWKTLDCIPTQGTLWGYSDGEPLLTPYDRCVFIMPSLDDVVAGSTITRLAHYL